MGGKNNGAQHRERYHNHQGRHVPREKSACLACNFDRFSFKTRAMTQLATTHIGAYMSGGRRQNAELARLAL